MTAVSRQDGGRVSSSPRLRKRLARIVTEIFAPTPLSAVVVAIVALHSASTPAEALRWGAIAVLFATFIPFGYILRGVRRRGLTDHHVGRRERRPLPLLVGIASVGVLFGLFVWLGAPRDLVALVGAMAAGLAVSLLITLVWKISVHAGVAAGTVAILVSLFGPLMLVLSPIAVLVAWARVEIGDHTLAQVIAGLAVGTVIATSVFALLR